MDNPPVLYLFWHHPPTATTADYFDDATCKLLIIYLVLRTAGTWFSLNPIIITVKQNTLLFRVQTTLRYSWVTVLQWNDTQARVAPLCGQDTWN